MLDREDEEVAGSLQWLYAYPTLSEKDVFKKAKKMRSWIKGRAKLESLLCSLWPFYQINLHIVSARGLEKRDIWVEAIREGLGEGRNWMNEDTIGNDLPFMIAPKLFLGKGKGKQLVSKTEFPHFEREVIEIPPILNAKEIKEYIDQFIRTAAIERKSEGEWLFWKAVGSSPRVIRYIHPQEINYGVFFPLWVAKYSCKGREFYFCFPGRQKSEFRKTLSRELDITNVICANQYIGSKLQR